MPETPFKWYDLVNGDAPLEQGDIIFDFPVNEPELNTIDISKQSEDKKKVGKFLEKRYDLIVMTQSCDFQKLQGDDRVIFCPSYAYSIIHDNPDWKKKLDWQTLIKGHIVSLHLINKCDIEGHTFEYQIINLYEVITIPFNFVKKIIASQDNRVRLLPPYREHLAQAFARQFIRVGLPIDLPQEDPYQGK